LIRTVLTDAQWERIAPLLPGKKGDPGRSGDDNRRSLEGILWIVRTGAPWRDLPDVFGNWFTVWKRFRRWALKGVFEKVFNILSGEPDMEYALIDGTIVKVHRHGAGQKGDSKSGHRQIARRPDHQSGGARRRSRQPGPFRSSSWPTSRQRRRHAADCRHRLQSARRRQGIR